VLSFRREYGRRMPREEVDMAVEGHDYFLGVSARPGASDQFGSCSSSSTGYVKAWRCFFLPDRPDISSLLHLYWHQTNKIAQGR